MGTPSTPDLRLALISGPPTDIDIWVSLAEDYDVDVMPVPFIDAEDRERVAEGVRALSGLDSRTATAIVAYVLGWAKVPMETGATGARDGG